MTYKVYPGINSYYVQMDCTQIKNSKLNELANYLTNSPQIEVTELRWSTITKIGTIILYCNKSEEKPIEYITKLVNDFYKNQK
ncbi:MAG: hypothetical protein PHH23_01850 [Paludibacteraceae bacterium]|nr:hypothetical protein [Paludibacteraceae bacterium]